MGRKKTLVLETTAPDLRKAGEIIRRGGLVVFPTETVYGLGADAGNAPARTWQEFPGNRTGGRNCRSTVNPSS